MSNICIYELAQATRERFWSVITALGGFLFRPGYRDDLRSKAKDHDTVSGESFIASFHDVDTRKDLIEKVWVNVRGDTT